MAAEKILLLHLTDSHLRENEPLKEVDVKISSSIEIHRTRENALKSTLQGVKTWLERNGRALNGVIITGDGTLQGDSKGQVSLRNMLVDELNGLITTAQFVVVPGNHDIVAGSKPSSKERYECFLSAWPDSDPGFVRPYLEGVDDEYSLVDNRHTLTGNGWVVLPVNTANYCQLAPNDKINEIIDRLKPDHADWAEKIRKETSFDIVRLSESQRSILKRLVDKYEGHHFRIACFHHHLLPINSREELKSFDGMTNLGAFRQILRDNKITMVVHGHKHSTAVYYDHIYDERDPNLPPHRVFVVSGGTFDTGLNEPARLIEIDDCSHAPSCRIISFGIQQSGRSNNPTESATYQIWEGDQQQTGPVVLVGASIDDLYPRVVQAADKMSDRALICVLDLYKDDIELPIPRQYPYEENDARRREWFSETVRWWQLSVSKIEARIPYLHGSRLRRFNGVYNQIERIIELLKDDRPETSRAIAMVIDPMRDLHQRDKQFASFILVQFCKRPQNILECIGYYRAQEFALWWPVNVAELRHLQLEVSKKARLQPGRIMTITPYPRVRTADRQPTKVAVPLIDQWTDNHPVRIGQIAQAMATGEPNVGIELWERCLKDLEQAATEFHPDGVPVALEGLRLLSAMLEALEPSHPARPLLKKLIRVNAIFSDNPKEQAFEGWKEDVSEVIADLRQLKQSSRRKGNASRR